MSRITHHRPVSQQRVGFVAPSPQDLQTYGKRRLHNALADGTLTKVKATPAQVKQIHAAFISEKPPKLIVIQKGDPGDRIVGLVTAGHVFANVSRGGNEGTWFNEGRLPLF